MEQSSDRQNLRVLTQSKASNQVPDLGMFQQHLHLKFKGYLHFKSAITQVELQYSPLNLEGFYYKIFPFLHIVIMILKVYFGTEAPPPTTSVKQVFMSSCPKKMFGYLSSPPTRLDVFLTRWTAQLFT